MTDNNNFMNPTGGFWDDTGADPWGLDDLDDIHKLLEDETGQSQEPAAESRSRRREQDSGKKSPSKSKVAKEKKEKPAKAKGRKAPAEPEEPFADLPSIKGGKTRSLNGEEPVKEKKPKEKKGKEKKEKPPKPPKDSAKVRQGKLTAVVFVVILSLILIGATVGGYMVTANPNTLPNVYVDGIFVGNMSREQVDSVLTENNWDDKVDTALTVKLPAGVSFQVDSRESGAKLTREKAVNAALSYGHDSNWYENLFRYGLNYIGPVDVVLEEPAIDESYVRSRIAEGISKLSKATEDEGYVVNEKAETLELIKGAGQIQLDEDSLYEQILVALKADTREISYSQLAGTIKMPDFQAIYDELAVEPEDAYFNDDFSVVDEVNGCWFDVEEAENLWKAGEPASKISIPLKLTYPETTAESLNGLLYRDKLGSQTTYYKWSTDNRISNINKVAEKLNGHIMMPGDVFSYNEYVGQRTKEAGFLEAGAYDNGQVVQEVGGGICQVSSTLYCASMFAQLETVERTNHYFKVDYLDYGLDATVSWPGPDFKFKNSRDYPVKIVAYCDNEEKALTIEIWGTDVDGTYVTLRHTSLCVYDPVYTYTTVGYGVSAYRTVYDAEGNFLYEVEEPYGIYYFHDEDIQWPAEKWADDAASGG